MIVRTWQGTVPLEHAAGFHRHLLATGVADYQKQPGCAQVQLWRRDAKGLARFVLVSWWHDETALRQFAGDDAEVAVLYPGDERYQLVPDCTVDHFTLMPLDADATAVQPPPLGPAEHASPR